MPIAAGSIRRQRHNPSKRPSESSSLSSEKRTRRGRSNNNVDENESGKTRVLDVGEQDDAEEQVDVAVEEEEHVDVAVEEEDDDDDDNDDGCNELAPAVPRRINRSGKPAETGIIKRVCVENFMCHRKLTVDLCPNVNFIHGQNGSGKSAILAAIQICLGAGARRTHRARNLAELIRKESNTGVAKISVTLLNEGDDGFERHIYGDSITVERIISSRTGGPNGYKLLDSHGKCKSTAKKDLDAMLDQLNIQVENPVAVLDQEDAKKFLTGKPEDKYAFFAKATDLERMDRTYANVVDHILELQTNQKRVEATMTTAIQNVKNLKKEVDEFLEVEKLEDKVADMRRAQGWAAYQEIQDDRDQAEQAFELALEKLAAREAQVERLNAMTTNEEEKMAKQARLDELTLESYQASELKRKLEQELKLAQEPIRRLERTNIQLKREIQKAEEKLTSAEARLRNARLEIKQREAESEQTKRLQELEDFKVELALLLDQEKSLREQQANELRVYQDLEPIVDATKENCHKLERQMGAVRQKIAVLQNSQGNSAAVYGGPNAARLAAQVQKLHSLGKWKGPVVGPIGSYIKIAPGKEKFAALAELALGPILDRFIVTNHHDRQLFMKLRTEIGCHRECNAFQSDPSIAKQRYRVPLPPVEGIETVATCLSIENILVFNTLVDQTKMDQNAVGTSKDETERLLLLTDNNGREFIRGGALKEIYFLPRGDMWKISSQGSRNLRSNERQLRQTIGADTTAAIQEAEKELSHLQIELGTFDKQLSQQAEELLTAKKTWNEVKKGQRTAKDAIVNLENVIGQLQTEIDASTNVEETDTVELEEDVSNAEQDLVVLNDKMESMEKEREELEPKVDEVKQKLEEVESRNERVLQDLNAAEKDLTLFMAKTGELEVQKEKAQSKVDRTKEKLAEFEEILNKKRSDSARALRQARLLQYRHDYACRMRSQAAEIGELEPPDLTPDDPNDDELESVEIIKPPKEAAYYAAKVERMKKKIVEEKARRKISNVSPDEAYEKYSRAKANLHSKNAQLETIQENIEKLEVDLKSRRKRWKMFRKHIVEMSTHTFDEILQLKGSSGGLEFDHNTKSLNLVVQKDNSNEESQTRDVKSLSGGERSFVTLSLLLALGERLETPFRVMDEFDVFLDAMARKIALMTLVEIAKKMDHRQFILITPQDLSNITPDDKVKIFKLNPPARNNAVVGLTQQTLD